MSYTIPQHIRGDTWDGMEITINEDGVPVDLTGSVIVMQFRERADYPEVLTFSTAFSATSAYSAFTIPQSGMIVVTEPLSGLVTIPELLIELPPKTYYYDLQVTFSTGRVRTYLDGTWKILADVSN